MTESNDDIFDHIKSVMRNHEEPYEEGAWERFKALNAPAPVKKAATVSIWKWAIAAAAVMTGIIFLARIFTATDTGIGIPNPGKELTTSVPLDTANSGIAQIAPATDSSFPTSTPLANTPRPRTADTYIIYDDKQTPAATPPIIYRTAVTGLKVTGIQKTLLPAVVAPQQVSVPGTPVIHQQQPQPQQPQQAKVDFWKNKIVESETAPAPVVKEQEKPVIVATTRPTLTNRPKTKEKSKKWQPSLYVSPLFGDLGIDMGYGVSVGYAINDKVRISSGIAHTRISASRSFNGGATGSLSAAAPPNDFNSGPSGPVGPGGATGATGATGAPGAGGGNGTSKPPTSLDAKGALSSAYNAASGQKTNLLQQITGSLSGVDIPIEVNYSISKKLYASAGVSGLVVINDNKTYTYVDNRNIKVSVETNKGTLKEDKTVMFNEQSTTSQPTETITQTTPFLGFYNLSLGYRQKINNKNAVSLEPFIKVPMKNAGDQNLKYLGTGIRLKFDL